MFFHYVLNFIFNDFIHFVLYCCDVVHSMSTYILNIILQGVSI